MDAIEVIRAAMEQQPPRLIGFRYTKKDGTTESYRVEPYEIDEDEGIFWGYKLNDKKPGIRKFFIAGMLNPTILPSAFTPRWPLYPYGK